ncbi:hypothetical protein BJF78_07335 [Pseudonocardia sp. CNS-139]|nr:hypothetical protein BJF78_07335 [Pseudonocardia sp. CNS-139]
MEHHPQGGNPYQRREAETTGGEAAAIESGIWDADQFGRPIDDATAQRIARQLATDQHPALADLATSGALPDGLEAELATLDDDLPTNAGAGPATCVATSPSAVTTAARARRGPA